MPFDPHPPASLEIPPFNEHAEQQQRAADNTAFQATATLDPRYALNDRQWIQTKYQDDQVGHMAIEVTDPDPPQEPTSGGPTVLSPSSPLDSARELVTRRYIHGMHRTLHHRQGDYYSWTGTHYVDLPGENIRSETYAFLDGAVVQAKGDKHAPFCPNKAKVTNVTDALAATTQLPHDIQAPAWLDRGREYDPKDILACSNGLLHLPTRTLLPHSPLFFGLNNVGYAFDPDAPEPKEWLAFLSSVWPYDQEQIDTLQEMMGLLLTQDTRHQKAFMMIGPKRSGKGTISRVLNALLGADNVAGPTLTGMADRFGLEALIGKPLAVIADARIGPRTDVHAITERLLAITGEDIQQIDRKFRPAWTGRLPTRFLILTNLLPNLKDTSGAVVSRFIVLVTSQSFYGREDRGLTDKLLKELSGILLWAVTGRDRLAERGHFIQPASANQVIQNFDDLSSPVRAFVRERCDVDQNREIERDALYAAWVEWCHENGRDNGGSKAKFGTELTGAVSGLAEGRPWQPDPMTGKRLRYYRGIDLR
jgi:putative DNA primase/helicase